MLFHIFLLLTIAWFILMAYLSHQDGEHTGRTSYSLAEMLSAHIHLFPHSSSVEDESGEIAELDRLLRRAAHVFLFTVFTILLASTLIIGGYSLWYLLAVVGWAYIDEASKPMIQGRHFSWFDVGLNLVGVIVGGIIVTFTL